MSSKLPDKRTITGWWRDFQWLQVTADGKMTCKICTWRAETAGIGTSGKFVIGSTNYQRSAVREHGSTGPHINAKEALQLDEAVK